MKNLSRQESKELIEKVRSGQPSAMDELFEQFEKIVHSYARRWSSTIVPWSRGMYEYNDIYQEIWLYILKRLNNYDPEKSNLMTWICIVCNSGAAMLYRTVKTHALDPEDGESLVSLNDIRTNNIGDEVELLDLIIDPITNIENTVLDESEIYYKIYVLSKFLSKQSQLCRICYFHYLKDISQYESANILGIAQSYVSRIRTKTRMRFHDYYEFHHKTINLKKVDKFAISLLTEKDDDLLSEELKIDLATIKICREILCLCNLYSTTVIEIPRQVKMNRN